MTQELVTIASEGDLEVVVLLETHSLLAEVIGSEYYNVGGAAPVQSAHFKSMVHFDHFLAYVNELITPGSGSIKIGGQLVTLSLVQGLERLCLHHSDDAEYSGLTENLAKLKNWLDTEEKVKFWCPDISKHVELSISRHQMITVATNATKHHLLRLSMQMKKVNSWFVKAGYTVSPQELIDVHNTLMSELRHALQYYATLLLQLLGGVFFGLNRLITMRFARNPTNDVSKMEIPAGVTSDVFKNLYGDVLVFHRYTDERIAQFTPVAGEFCCGSYWADK